MFKDAAAMRRFGKVVVGSIGLACGLGICVDLITANVAVEYFSVHHPRIVPSENPWVLAIVWGIAASWWFGAIGGVVVAFINHRRQQPLEAHRILKWTLIACMVLWVVMMAILGGVMAISSQIPLEQRTETFEADRRLVAVAMAHQYEYVFGGIALIIIGIMTWRRKS